MKLSEELPDDGTKEKLPWQTPKLTIINVDETAGGTASIPESSDGYLS